ncbi:MAG: EAL domain-containing protein [Lachnospiraceae bacterium]|nr:EAL domain-containing protein [Lachnospiraceae bacterium]
MKTLYIVTLCGAMLYMNYLGIHIRVEKNPLVKALRQLIIVVTVKIMTGMLAILIPEKEIALFMQCAHYASTEWLLIFLLRFMEQYTEGVKSNKITRTVIYFLAVVSNVSLFLNNVFHHVVTSQYTDIGNGVMCYVFTNRKPWYNFHLYFSYLLAAFIMSILLVQAYRTSRFYRKKFTIALIMLVVTLLMDGICNIMNFPLDYSLYVYIALTVFFTYYSVYYIPQRLITRTLSYVIADSHSGVVCFDIDGKCIYANEEALRIYGIPNELSVLEKLLKKEIGTDEFSEVEERKWEKVFQIETRKLHYLINFNKLFDEQGGYIGCYLLMYDKTDDVERLNQERYRATHDSLTGLFNRDYFYEKVMSILKKEPNQEYYMVCINIKDFKLINNLYGFKKGNDILIRFAEVMSESLPNGAVCGRMESDHFAFCIPKDLFQEELVLSSVGQVVPIIESSDYQIHIHAGVYTIQKEDYDVSVMCDRANMAIDTVKNNYECTIAYYDKQLMERVMHGKQLVGEFESALEDKQFLMFLQPQVATDGTVLGAEALVRWNHPEKGMISPGLFIEVFENAGLIHYLDQYIWELAAQKLKEWKENGRENLYISVNISTKDFYYLDIYKTFTELVERYDILPEKLKLEITETALMLDLDKQLVLLDKLQRYGFHIEIDDFGSGYSSLNMLKDIRADVLKIDMGFLRKTQNHDRSKIILGMIVNLAKQLQMAVITEGVENKEQVDYLTEAGCDIFQGYYFERPINVSEFELRYLS